MTTSISPLSELLLVFKNIRNDYESVKDDKNLGKTFHKSGQTVATIETVLQWLRKATKDPLPAEFKNILEACGKKAKQAQRIFYAVAHEQTSSRYDSYKEVVQGDGEGEMVEDLLIGMMSNLCDLADKDPIKGRMEAQAKKLRTAIDELSKMAPSIPKEPEPGHCFTANHNAHQFNAIRGTQNNNPGNGHQFHQSTFSGGVTFGKNC